MGSAMRHASATALFGLLVATMARADAVGYAGIVDVEASAGGVTCRHHHDWSGATSGARFDMISGKTQLFSAANTYAWIACSKGDETLFKAPAPALTRLLMSDDGRFVVGVTTVKLWNPVQIAVWETASGKRLFAAMVAAIDACFAPADYQDFLTAHPAMRPALHERAVLVDGVVHVDLVYRKEDEAALSELIARHCPSYIARNISESVSNWIGFYAGPSPYSSEASPLDPRFRIENGRDGRPAFLEFLDIKGMPARVDLHPRYVEGIAP